MGRTLFWPLFQRERLSPATLDVIEYLPTTDELDSEPSVEELSKAIDSLASGKAPGNYGIPPELIKHCKTILLLPLLLLASAGKKELYRRIWGTPKSSSYARTRARGTTVTTTEASQYSALSAKYFFGSYWYASRSWRGVSTRNHNVASELNGQQ